MNTTTITLCLTDEQKQELVKQLTSNTFVLTPPVARDRFKHLQLKTKRFIIELEENYGNNWINRRDDLVDDLLYKYRVRDLGSIIKKIGGEIIYTTNAAKNSGSLRIAKFKTRK
jgi:hypothetical protein